MKFTSCTPMPVSAAFTPYTAVATATLDSGFVVGATVSDGGCGYTNAPPCQNHWRRWDWGASGGHLVTNGFVVSVNITNAGSGYTDTPVVVIEPPFIPQPIMGIAVQTFGPLVTPVLQLGLANLAPYDKYQLEFTPTPGGTWTNLGALFIPTATTNTQYATAIGGAGFIRVKIRSVVRTVWRSVQGTWFSVKPSLPRHPSIPSWHPQSLFCRGEDAHRRQLRATFHRRNARQAEPHSLVAKRYLRHLHAQPPCRFDILSVVPSATDGALEFTLRKGAFTWDTRTRRRHLRDFMDRRFWRR